MDWVEFLEDHNVGYVTRGPNTKRGEVSVRCPWCGEDDPSEHLGISLTTENWGCLRNQQHRGHSPVTLIRALLGCSFSQAKLVSDQYSRPDPDNLEGALKALGGMEEAPQAKTASAVTLPSVRAIRPEGLTVPYWRYLERRGFDDVQSLVRRYGLTACLTGPCRGRIVWPFYKGGELVAWTARAITNPILSPRYLSSEGDAIKTMVLHEDELLKGGELLFVTEGPFDALKVDFYGEQAGVRATCVFGTSITMDQIAVLSLLRKRFRTVVILFDQDAVEPGFFAAEWLNANNVHIGQLPHGCKDPGDLSRMQVSNLIREYQ